MEIGGQWKEVLKDELSEDYYIKLLEFLEQEYKEKVIYPPKDEIFNAFLKTDFNHVRVVILGQDPYHGAGQGHGLAFSVVKGNKIPPSLNNIYKEIVSDCCIEKPSHGELTSWANQGVLLLNSCLTVEAGKANSHKGKGWEKFTDKVLSCLNDKDEPIVFILWGNDARNKRRFITNTQHLVLESPHPSPLSASRGFFGCGHFSKTNEFLKDNNQAVIDWQI